MKILKSIAQVKQDADDNAEFVKDLSISKLENIENLMLKLGKMLIITLSLSRFSISKLENIENLIAQVRQDADNNVELSKV